MRMDETRLIPCPKCGTFTKTYNDGCYYPDFDFVCEKIGCEYAAILSYECAIHYKIVPDTTKGGE